MTSPIEYITTTAFRGEYGDVFKKAEAGIPSVVQNRGRNVAVVISNEMWEHYLKLQHQELRDLVSQRATEETEPLRDAMEGAVNKAPGGGAA
ncbi:type II toxin-antitoxin system prevent-host-death family antitoxin [Streptomyces noursei]